MAKRKKNMEGAVAALAAGHPFLEFASGQPWLITREAMEALQASVSAASADDIEDRAGLFIFGEERKKEEPYTVSDGFAVIRVRGSLTAEPTWFGGSSYAKIADAARAADADSRVERILLDIASPGGTVAGGFEAAAGLARLNKPLYAWANGQMTSGAFLIGTAAKMIGAPKTAQIGSIGVITAHVDESKLDEKIGVKVTYLTAGKYKAFGNPSEPLSDAARSYIQERLDALYSIFVDVVAKTRGMSIEKTLAAADGKVFLAQDAMDAGLVDGIFDDMADFMNMIKNKEDSNMDLNELKTKHPDLVKQISDAARADADKDAAAKIAASEKAGIEKILAIVKTVAGDEVSAKIDKIVGAGLTADQLAAVMGIMAVKPEAPAAQPAENAPDGEKAKILASLQAAGTPPLNQVKPTESVDAKFEDLLVGYMKDNPKVKKSDAIFALRKENPAAYEKWLEGKQAK